MSYDHEKLKEAISTYQLTVWAIVAVLNHLRWNEQERRLDSNIPFGVGRVFKNDEGNELTPDAAVQRNSSVGVVAEVKHTFPPTNEHERRDEILQQLKNYDVDLVGWWTQNARIPNHDIVLLTHDSHVVDAVDYFEQATSGNGLRFDKNLAILAFHMSTQHRAYFALRKYFGDLSDGQVNARLRRGVQIDWESVRRSVGGGRRRDAF